MARTRAQENRAIRQEALREQLSKQKHVEQVVEITNQLAEPGADIPRLKAKADIHLALIKKYIPDLKATELSIEQDTLQQMIADRPMDDDEWEQEHCVESTEGSTEGAD